VPSTDTPVADLGAPLRWLLLSSLGWVALGALIVGGVCWSLAARNRDALLRARQVVLGPAPGRGYEPRARRFLRLAFGLLWVVDGLLQAQSKMPGSFVAEVLQPGISTGPSWFGDVVTPMARAWTRHPVAADVATVWVQLGLGLLILIGGRGALAKLALWGSIAWSLAVWFLGEAFGGLLAAGASWLTGAPGAALIYAATAALLLLPREWWMEGRAQRLCRQLVSVWFLAGAGLQALPGERQWQASGLSEPFVSRAGISQPAAAVQPILRLGALAARHPVAVNATIIALLLAAAAGLWLSGRTAVIVAGLVLCAATWWLAQDFGVLGGTATDPNSGLPLGLLLAAALPGLSPAVAEAVGAGPPESATNRLRTGLRAALVTLAVGLTFVVPVVLASTLGRPADAAAVAADSNGGVRRVPPRPAAAFALTDQRGRLVSTSSLRGKLVVLTFLDPVCTSDCPLIGVQLASADRDLGALATQVEFVAIDTNPIFHFQSDVEAFSESHGLAGFANWHFLYGAPETVQDILAAYGISVEVPAVGMIEHSEGVYFVTPDGLQAAYLDDGASAQLTWSYAEQVRDEIRSLLP
jgi:cytochrome oxidase Cu insertion factor (SCO1/SenC/PrrC family)